MAKRPQPSKSKAKPSKVAASRPTKPVKSVAKAAATKKPAGAPAKRERPRSLAASRVTEDRRDYSKWPLRLNEAAGYAEGAADSSPAAALNLGRDRSSPSSRVGELSWAHFDAMVQDLAAAVRQGGKRWDAVVGVAHGGVFVGGALASALGCEFFPVRISRRSRDSSTKVAPKLQGEMPRELKGRSVLIVDDVASSGDTLELARSLATRVGAKAVGTVCLVSRAEGFTPDYVAITTQELIVFPWDYKTVAEDGRFDVDPDRAGA